MSGLDGLIPEFEETDFRSFDSQISESGRRNGEEKSHNGVQNKTQRSNNDLEELPKVSFDFLIPKIGLKVVIPRNDGKKHAAFVSKVITPTDDIHDVIVEVEWLESDGVIKGKTLDLDTLLDIMDIEASEKLNETADCQVTDSTNLNIVSNNIVTFNNQNNLPSTSNTNQTINLNTNSTTSTVQLDVDTNTSELENKIICKTCCLSFKNERGLKTHTAKKHPAEANQRKLDSILKNKNKNKDVVNSLDDHNHSNNIDSFDKRFKDLLSSDLDNFQRETFDLITAEFLSFLREANDELPGPKHPAMRYYRMRKRNKNNSSSKGAKKTSNPQRNNKAAREKRQQQYQYEVAQYNYYNRRKKVVNNIMNADQPKQCNVNINVVEKHYKSLFEEKNDNQRENYENKPSKPNIISVKAKDVHKAIKSTSLDTSPGLDGVLIRTIKALDISHVIKTIIDLILKFSYVPKPLREGRTILIYKGKGDTNSLSSWRPITMYSIVRRIIEKVLDAELRRQVSFHPCQRGFIRGLPGCHVNARLMNAVLQDAYQNKKDAVVTLLDVTGAFDNVGHNHVMKSLESNGVSTDLAKGIEALLCNNTIIVYSGPKQTAPILVCRGVPQGGPISSTLFNLSIDHIFKEICDPQIANNLGYDLRENKDRIVLTGFADDQAVTSCGIKAAERLINMIQRRFREIGLAVNPLKSTALVINKGQLCKQTLHLEDGSQILSSDESEPIKYLGCTFKGELTYNEESIRKLNDNLNKLTNSDLLKPDQKLNVLNQYLFPTLTYPLQCAPLTKLPATLLDGIDVNIRRSTKAIIGLPANTASAMLYSPRRFRGLGILKCSWEAPLQHLSIAQKLNSVPDSLFQDIYNFEEETTECLRRLNVVVESTDNLNVRKIRQTLREKSFEEWSNYKWQGVGVKHFKDFPLSNKYISERKVLTGSEWVNAIKLNTNYAPLRGVPGHHSGDVGSLCRKCGRENETPAHVLGKCPNNMLLVTKRHHNVKHKIADALKEKNYICYDEVYAIDSDGSPRYSDIIAFHPSNKTALIIDPTIRYETNNPEQDEEVHSEKTKIYEKCINYYKEKFREAHGDREFNIHGLWFGSRGTIPLKTKLFFDKIGIDHNFLRLLGENIILDSLGIINNHIY